MPDDVLNGILDSASDDQSANSTGRTPLVIDSDLRTIKVPTDYVFGVQNDQDVLTVPFVSPRYCDGVDLSELSIRINFTTKSGLSSYYDVTDKTVNTDTIEFAWLLGAAVFVSVGDLTFAVCIRKVEADGRITKEFNTTLATAKILPGLTVEDQKDLTQYSILVQMQNLVSSVNSTIEDAEDYAEQLRNYVGAPLVATAASDMTDQNRIYVYVGNENGYNNGHWYYYQSLTWHDGGTYSALPAGDYPDIYAGNVMSDRYQTDQTPYLLRKTGGTLDGIGERCYETIIGASVVENQLKDISSVSSGTVNGVTFTNNGDGSVTASGTATADTQFDLGISALSSNHKYLIIGCPSGGSASTYYMGNASYMDTGNGKIFYSGSASATGYRIYVKNGVQINKTFLPQFTDLTLRFGSSIADYIYTLETATAGAGVAKLRSWGFLKGYQAHNAGSIESVEVTEKKCVGFNQWDEEWEVGSLDDTTGQKISYVSTIRSVNYTPVLPNTNYYIYVGTNSAIRMFFYDADKNFISFVATGNALFTTPSNAHYIMFRTYQIYGTTYNHDICINISSDRNGEYEAYTSQTYALGSGKLRGIFKLDSNNNLYADGDRKEADGTVTRKYGVIDLGAYNWAKSETRFYAAIAVTDPTAPYPFANTQIANAICPKYVTVNRNNLFTTDKSLSVHTSGTLAYINIYDTAYENADEATFKTAMSGVMLVYELATPTTEQSTPFVSAQTVYPDGTEQFVTENGVPVGHVTKYPYDLKTQAERLIDVPDVPSTNGTYVLKATRSSSGINYTWVTG